VALRRGCVLRAVLTSSCLVALAVPCRAAAQVRVVPITPTQSVQPSIQNAAAAPPTVAATDIPQQPTDYAHIALVDARPLYERPHTTAAIQLGILALPAAPISPARVGGETPFGTVGRGDATVMAGLDILFRAAREWEVGAAARFGPSPTRDDNYGASGGLPRSHSRSYLLVGVEGRYIPLHYRTLEGWVGVAAGAVVIADRYETKAGEVVPTVLGIREVTVSTEGLSVGVQFGGNWNIGEHWVAGAGLRIDRWFLPTKPACSAVGDCATLKDQATALQFGLSIGYRIAL
jgi:hypothetical protein